jgi:hypothetical protein
MLERRVSTAKNIAAADFRLIHDGREPDCHLRRADQDVFTRSNEMNICLSLSPPAPGFQILHPASLIALQADEPTPPPGIRH